MSPEPSDSRDDTVDDATGAATHREQSVSVDCRTGALDNGSHPDDFDDPPVPSPCVGICVLDPGGSGVCTGCGRSLDEIAAWSQLTNAVRREVLARLAARLAGLRERNRVRHWDDDAKR